MKRKKNIFSIYSMLVKEEKTLLIFNNVIYLTMYTRRENTSNKICMDTNKRSNEKKTFVAFFNF